MRNLRLTLFYAALVCALPSSSLFAQEEGKFLPDGVEKVSATSQFAGTWHPARGFVAASSTYQRSGPATLYSSAGTGLFYNASADQEYIDEGRLVSRNHDEIDQINGMTFSYCSSSTNPNGTSATFTFYDQVVPCSGVSNWPISQCSYQLFNLPGGSNGNQACWVVSIDLAGLECNLKTDPSGSTLFGWGQTWDEPSAIPLGVGGLGAVDSYEVYDTTAPNANAAYLGCFDFGGAPLANFAVDLFGPPAETRSYYALSPGVDDSLILSADASFVAGTTVNYAVIDGAGGPGVASALWVSPNQVEVHLGTAFGIDAHMLASYSSRHIPPDVLTSATGNFALALPASMPSGYYYLQAGAGSSTAPTAMSHGLRQYIP